MTETKTMIHFFTIADYEEEEIWLRGQHGSGWKMVEVRDVRVWHTGYSSSLMRSKAERNLSILLSERERRLVLCGGLLASL